MQASLPSPSHSTWMPHASAGDYVLWSSQEYYPSGAVKTFWGITSQLTGRLIYSGFTFPSFSFLRRRKIELAAGTPRVWTRA